MKTLVTVATLYVAILATREVLGMLYDVCSTLVALNG